MSGPITTPLHGTKKYQSLPAATELWPLSLSVSLKEFTTTVCLAGALLLKRRVNRFADRRIWPEKLTDLRIFCQKNKWIRGFEKYRGLRIG